MSLQVRLLGPEEERVLGRVAEGVFDDPVQAPAAAEFLADPRHHLAVALDGEVVVGFASAVHYVHPDKEHPELWINEVGVAPSHEGRSLGKELMRALLKIGQELGCREAWVLTDRANARAMSLYASVGGEQSPDDEVMYTFPIER